MIIILNARRNTIEIHRIQEYELGLFYLLVFGENRRSKPQHPSSQREEEEEEPKAPPRSNCDRSQNQKHAQSLEQKQHVQVVVYISQ